MRKRIRLHQPKTRNLKKNQNKLQNKKERKLQWTRAEKKEKNKNQQKIKTRSRTMIRLLAVNGFVSSDSDFLLSYSSMA